MKKQTVIQQLVETVERYPDRDIFKEKKFGRWEAITWQGFYEEVLLFGRGLIQLGVQQGDGLTILGANCTRWVISDLAAIAVGAIPAGIYTTNSPEQCSYIAGHCEASVAVVENESQLQKFKEIKDQLPKLKAIVMMDGTDDDEMVHRWEDVLDMGRSVEESELQARIDALDAQDTATLVYTSGTTGNPKGVMLSHENILWTAKVTLNFENITERDQWLSYLPLSHIAEQLITVYGTLNSGGCVYFVESLEKLGDTLREVRPNFFFAVPRVWEKIKEKMEAAGAENPALRKMIIRGAKKVGLYSGYAEQRGEKKPLLYCFADRIIFNKVKEKLGLDRARLCFTAAAPISRDTLEFFLSLGVPIYEIFGMSETTGPGTLSLPHRYKTGTCGFPLPGTDIKIAEDGELLLRGPHIFKGYYKNEKATKEAIDEDGWLHSGDIAEFDEEGYVKITDRKKDIIITAGGKNIAPQVIEGKLKDIPMVEHAVVIGDQKKYLSALITLNGETLSDLAQNLGIELQDMASMAESDKVKNYVAEQIELVNQTMSKVEGIKKFTILGNGFTIDSGELTPTMKVKRKFIHNKYSKEIDGLY